MYGSILWLLGVYWHHHIFSMFLLYYKRTMYFLFLWVYMSTCKVVWDQIKDIFSLYLSTYTFSLLASYYYRLNISLPCGQILNVCSTIYNVMLKMVMEDNTEKVIYILQHYLFFEEKAYLGESFDYSWFEDIKLTFIYADK